MHDAYPAATRVHSVMGVPMEIIDGYADRVLRDGPSEFSIDGYPADQVRAAAEVWAAYRRGDTRG